MAASDGRDCLPESCAAFDAAGRHRLAQTAEDLDTGDCSVSDYRDSPLSMRLLWMISSSFHGILQP